MKIQANCSKCGAYATLDKNGLCKKCKKKKEEEEK